jgi:hypothetical protein
MGAAELSIAFVEVRLVVAGVTAQSAHAECATARFSSKASRSLQYMAMPGAPSREWKRIGNVIDDLNHLPYLSACMSLSSGQMERAYKSICRVDMGKLSKAFQIKSLHRTIALRQVQVR